MKSLSARDRELVALGAALGSNCVPCIEYHIPEARTAGLSDHEIGEAIRLADNVRQVPAAKVLKSAMTMIGETGEPSGSANADCSKQSRSPIKEPCCV